MFQDKGDWSRRQRQDAGAGARRQEHEQAREDGAMRPICSCLLLLLGGLYSGRRRVGSVPLLAK